MKLLFISQFLYPVVGGAERSTTFLIEELRRRGHIIDYVCESNADDVDISEGASYDAVCTQLRWTPTAIQIAKFGKVPLVFFFHSWEHLCTGTHITQSYCGQKCKGCQYKNSDPQVKHVISNSLYSQRILEEEQGLESEMIYPMMDLERTKPRYRFPKFITMARLHPGKGTDRFMQLADRFPEYRFRIVGYGDRNVKMPPNVFTTGHMDPRDYYKDTSVWVAPFRTESFGMTIIEAQYNGIPVLASNIGAVKEDHLVEYGQVVNAPDNIDEWEENLKQILHNVMPRPLVSSAMAERFDPMESVSQFERYMGRIL